MTLASACADDPSAPERLLDGSLAVEPPVTLDGVTGPRVLTRVRKLGLGEIEPGSPSAGCLRLDWDARPAGPVVERVGVESESVTFRDRSGLGLYGCDNSPGRREARRRWCGTAFGMLHARRLRDPRLDLTCTTANEDPIGFVWVQPSSRTRYVSVAQPGFTEVYPTGGGLAVRVASAHDVDIERARAAFELLEHDGRGRLLRRYWLEAAVAG